jgi:hypothetical protein
VLSESRRTTKLKIGKKKRKFRCSTAHNHDGLTTYKTTTTTTTANISIMTSITEQEKQQEVYNREEEYSSAQRAATEAIHVGRTTLETAVQQGEQLQNAENAADDTEYKLDRAARLLREMTWPGWLANKFSRDSEPPEYKNNNSNNSQNRNGPPTVYENVPETVRQAAQAVQNYHANLLVLDACETEEQKETCVLICDNMLTVASKQIKALQHQNQLDDISLGFSKRLAKDLGTLRERQHNSQRYKGGSMTEITSNSKCNIDYKDKDKDNKIALFGNAHQQQQSSSLSYPAPQSPNDSVAFQQEEHLDSMALHLGELQSIAHNLNQSFEGQHTTLESLDTKSDSMLFKSRMVTRRTDRMIQKKSWVKDKPDFVSNVSFRHVKSGKYLAVSANFGLVLSAKFNETCIFGFWKRQGIFGLQSKYSKRWVGQNLLGNLACSSTAFGRREEWDADSDWSETPLLCSSAGWGNGGYILVQTKDESLLIGGGGLEDKKRADLWCIAEKE